MTTVTPVLTKKQQRQSLSAKKGPIKGLRNVLAQPYETYWPILNAEQSPTLENVLKEVTTVLRRPGKLIPWSQLRQMKKEERQKARKEALAKQQSLPDEKIMSSVVIGVNAVTRALEKNTVCCVLLDSKVEPLLLIKHVVTMAQNMKVPVILIPSLKSITQITVGFPCAAFALKNFIIEEEGHHFHTLYKEILKASTNLPPPKHSLQLFKTDITNENDESPEDDETSEVDEPKDCNEEIKRFTISSNVYKYRTSRTERAFIPPGADEKADNVIQPAKSGNDFIGFASDDDSMECEPKTTLGPAKNRRYININQDIEEQPTDVDPNDNEKIETSNNENKRKGPEITYVSLKVKRVQGNSNRTKATKTPKKKK